jgi:hypothetical protein
MATEGVTRPTFKDRLRGVGHALRLDAVGRAWGRIPGRARGLIPGLLLLAVAALYPIFYGSSSRA